MNHETKNKINFRALVIGFMILFFIFILVLTVFAIAWSKNTIEFLQFFGGVSIVIGVLGFVIAIILFLNKAISQKGWEYKNIAILTAISVLLFVFGVLIGT